MVSDDEVLVFVNNISVECPICNTKTHYLRRGYDGEEGEGQYCETCKKFIVQAGWKMIKASEIENWKQKVKEFMNKV